MGFFNGAWLYELDRAQTFLRSCSSQSLGSSDDFQSLENPSRKHQRWFPWSPKLSSSGKRNCDPVLAGRNLRLGKHRQENLLEACRAFISWDIPPSTKESSPPPAGCFYILMWWFWGSSWKKTNQSWSVYHKCHKWLKPVLRGIHLRRLWLTTFDCWFWIWAYLKLGKYGSFFHVFFWGGGKDFQIWLAHISKLFRFSTRPDSLILKFSSFCWTPQKNLRKQQK